MKRQPESHMSRKRYRYDDDLWHPTFNGLHCDICPVKRPPYCPRPKRWRAVMAITRQRELMALRLAETSQAIDRRTGRYVRKMKRELDEYLLPV